MKNIYGIFLKGLLTLLPITLTLYIIAWAVTRLESGFAEPLQRIVPEPLYFPGLGFILSLLLIFFVGLIVNNYLAAQGLAWLESKFERIPFVKAIYNPLRDVMNLFNDSSSKNLKRVVMVDLFSGGASVLGLVTRDNFNDFPAGVIHPDQVAVFVPYSYGVGGFTILVSRSQTREIDMPVDKAMQLAITGWIKTH
jgi:uncharacterized membrane protein